MYMLVPFKFLLALSSILLIYKESFAADLKPKVSVLILSQFHADEVEFKTGSEWFALFPGEGGGELRKGELVIERVYDAVADEEGKATGKLIKFKEGEKVWSGEDEGAPIAILSGPGIKTGPVDGEGKIWSELYIGYEYYFRFKEYAYTLYVTGLAIDADADSGVPMIIKDYCVKVLKREAKGSVIGSQKLFCFPHTEGSLEPVNIKWSGDLNGDDQPDFIISGSDHYNKSETRLYLSYQGTKGEIWYEAGIITGVGC